MTHRRTALIALVPILVIAIVLWVYLNQTFPPFTTTIYSTVSITSNSSTSTQYTEPVDFHPNVEKSFDFDHIPYNFTLGNFAVQLVNNGTGYEAPSGNGTVTAYLGFTWVFNVTTPDRKTKSVIFVWLPTDPCIQGVNVSCISQSDWILPNPENFTVMYGNVADLYIGWILNSTSLYVSFTQWEQAPNVGPQPSIYVSGSCPTDSETYPNTMTPWTAPESNKTVEITNLTVFFLGPASDLDGNTSPPSQNLSMKGGQVLYYDVWWTAQPFNYNIDSVYTNTSGFSLDGICSNGRMVSLPQSVIEGTNFGFEVLLQLPLNSTYSGPVNIYIQTGQKTPGCGNCNGTA